MCVCMYVCMYVEAQKHAETGYVYVWVNVCTLIFIMTDLFLSVKKHVFVHFRTETLRTKLEPVHFRSGIESWVFFSGKKKVNHYENESMYVFMYKLRSTKKKGIYMCAYTYVCMYVCRSSGLWRKAICTYEHVCIHMYACMFKLCIGIFVYVYVCVCMCLWMYVCV